MWRGGHMDFGGKSGDMTGVEGKTFCGVVEHIDFEPVMELSSSMRMCL